MYFKLKYKIIYIYIYIYTEYIINQGRHIINIYALR